MKRITGDLNLIKNINELVVLNSIRNLGPISRADLARITGLNPSTITDIVNSFLDREYVKESNLGESTGGRKPLLLELNLPAFLMVGVLLSDELVSLVMDARGNILSRVAEDPAPLEDAPNSSAGLSMKRVVRLIRKALKSAGIGTRSIRGIGVGITGLVDSVNGVAIFSPNLGWENVNVKQTLENEFGVPVMVDNDVKAMALGELWFGAGKGLRHVVVFNMDEGLGAAIIINGEIYRGANGSAGEVGHSPMGDPQKRCRCGNSGCLETVTGGTALVADVRNRVLAGTQTKVLSMAGGDVRMITSQIIFEAARSGDEVARSSIDKLAHYLGLGIASAVNELDPECVILGGNTIYEGGELLLEGARRSCSQHVFGVSKRAIRIELARLGRDSSPIGAGALVLKRILGTGNSSLDQGIISPIMAMSKEA
ncbi:MAG: ROK family transcriptional regulator [Firmicutes bacterium]|nr:ROK family transcriptional regulator [Bacillota bacterium]